MSDPSEFVGSDPTNPSEDKDIIKARLVVGYPTNYLNFFIEGLSDELVGWVYTRYYSNDKRSEILKFIIEKKAWVMPALHRSLNIDKGYSYDEIKKYMTRNLVKKTKISLEPPIEADAGRRPTIYSIHSVNLKGAMDPLVLKAREFYYSTISMAELLGQESDLSVENLQIEISRVTADYYISRLRTDKSNPPPSEVLEYIKTNFPDAELSPHDRYQLAKKISNQLFFHKGGGF